MEMSAVLEIKNIASLDYPKLLHDIISMDWKGKDNIKFTESRHNWTLKLDTGEWSINESIIYALKDTSFWESYLDDILYGRVYYFAGIKGEEVEGECTV